MSGDGGKDLQSKGLGEIAKGITLTLGELKELGIDSLAGAGRGFSGLSLSGLELGHDEIRSALASFCERWEWGVRALVMEGSAFAEGVGLAAGTLYETDAYVEGALKIGANAVLGNPYASEDEVTRMGWGELAGHSAMSDPDFSERSFDEAGRNIKQGWQDAGRDVMTSHTISPLGIGVNPENLRAAAGVSDDDYDRFLDDTFGPSREERAEEQGGGAG